MRVLGRRYDKACKRFDFEEGALIAPPEASCLINWEEKYYSSMSSDMVSLWHHNGLFFVITCRVIDTLYGYKYPYGIDVDATPHYAEALRRFNYYLED